ncbi:MAG UNVERIFIED_CONTAM: glycosyltransferase family 39 protein [Anaerolineae bacterium]|jgi:4-amino-4-deoxy-L-arabinose transferase-like glycosyltransferase
MRGQTSVQWFALVVCIIGAGVLARQMGGNRLTQWVASALVASIPMAVLQASSTQTDLVVSMWLVAFAVMTLHYTETRSRFDLACAGFALGLCILSKGTAYVLAFPMGVWFLVWVWRVNRWRSWQPWLIAGACVVLVNVGHWTRNQLLFHTPIGAADGYPTRHSPHRACLQLDPQQCPAHAHPV